MTDKKDKRKKQVNWFKYFFMKWRFRMDQARAIFSLLTFAALLAASYVKYITFFDDIGFWGVVLFSIIIVTVFSIGGYIYDKILKLWKATIKVSIERNPYSYTPGPKEHVWTKGQMAYQTLVFLNKNTLKHDELYAELLVIYYSQDASSDFEANTPQMRQVCNQLNNDLIEILKSGNTLNKK